MNKLWSDKAWDDYLYWQTQDKKTLKKINELVKDIERNGVSKGIGKPEGLNTVRVGAGTLTRKTALSTM